MQPVSKIHIQVIDHILLLNNANIYIHTCTMYPSFRLYILSTHNTDPGTTTTSVVVVVVAAVLLLSLLQAASPWPASSSDSIFQTRTVFCLENKSFAF